MTPSVVIAVLTYRRNAALAALLPHLLAQMSEVPNPTRVLVVDNDPQCGAREAVSSASPVVAYVCEPTPGIAAARNRALTEATDDLLIFIDDDERPSLDWLRSMLAAMEKYDVNAVVGPVVHEYETPLDPWLEAGGFFDRPRPLTGTPMRIGATNNLLLDMRVIRRLNLRFDADFGLSGGSDTLFTRQFSARGGTMVWCDEGAVSDPVPASRTTRKWAMRRVFRMGNTWARVQVRSARGPASRVMTRLVIGSAGIGRTAVGAIQWLIGVAIRSVRHRAGGVRLMMRGAGMTGGAFGYVYMEYKRPPVVPAPSHST